ncbi:MAG: hypothetical protein LW806_08850 [Planctomycetaceae bacterium]|jgi:hypothetical protein|nr:hypothetical protein [Planctomycetaceae bacterium]
MAKSARKSVKKTKKAVKKAAKKTVKTAAKKAAKKTVKKAAKKAVKRTVRIAATSVAAIAPVADGERWELFLEDGSSMIASAAAAQSIQLGVGGAWNAAVARKLSSAEDDQRAFADAMKLLAKGRKVWTRTTLVAKLGGDARARRAVTSLAANGWIA